MEFVVDGILDAKIASDQENVILSLAAGSQAVTYRMSWRVASALIDSLAARNDELMAARAPQAPGMHAAAFRTCHTADAQVDVTNTMMLMMFDRGKPHQVGVAIALAAAQAAGRRIEQLAKKDRKQKRQ